MPHLDVPERQEDASSFNLDDPSSFERTTLGAWEVYTQRDPWSWSILFTAPLGVSDLWRAYRRDIPYIRRVLADLWAVSSGYIMLYFLTTIPTMFLPAAGLWYSGQIIQIVQTAVDTRVLNQEELVKTIVVKLLCKLVEHFFIFTAHRLQRKVGRRSSRAFTARLFKAMARLDVPTSLDPTVQSHLHQLTESSPFRPMSAATTAVMALSTSTALAGKVISMVSQVVVLFALLRNRNDGTVLAAITAVRYAFTFMQTRSAIEGPDTVWIAGTENRSYLRMMGLYQTIRDSKHRQEIFANNLASYMHGAFQKLQARLGDVKSQSFWEATEDTDRWRALQLPKFAESAIRELPMVYFATRAIHSPLSIPISMASLNVVEQATTTFFEELMRLRIELYGFSDSMRNLRTLYDLGAVPNLVVDGAVPFPENSQSLCSGVSVEFHNVSFRYPGKEEYAVRNISFRVEAGQLCVIVGTNGSGKSTILSLITRVYDATEGEILVDGKDIRTLKLHDLHRAMAVLFQDYTHFQLSLRDNIAIGDPENADDNERVMEAARLGGVDTIIEKLPEKYDTYLHRPVQDILMNVPQGVKRVFARDVTGQQGHSLALNQHDVTNTWLSGGQMQKLAVSRTFMRSLPDDPRVGLLLFDEPAAHLDPRAEYDLFARLRTLRGEKTMFFSTHRFGNLTRHADLILYMNESVIVESGTHGQLLKRGGQYEELWKMQAQAFV